MSGESDSLHRNASPPPMALEVGFERGREKSRKQGGVASNICAGVVE